MYTVCVLFNRDTAVRYSETAAVAAARSLRNPDSQRPDQISFAIKKIV